MRARGGRIIAGAVALAAAVLVAACGDDAGPSSPYPGDGPCYACAGHLARPWPSIPELYTRSDLIAVVEPTGERSEVWDAVGVYVSSRFTASVVRVLKGAVQPGDSILLFAPGGIVREPFPAADSRRPVTGSPTAGQEYVDWPWFRAGVRELVFLHYNTPGDGDPLYAPFYSNLGPSTRFSIDAAGKLRSIYPPGTDVEDPGGVRIQLDGLTVDEVQARVTAAVTP